MRVFEWHAGVTKIYMMVFEWHAGVTQIYMMVFEWHAGVTQIYMMVFEWTVGLHLPSCWSEEGERQPGLFGLSLGACSSPHRCKHNKRYYGATYFHTLIIWNIIRVHLVLIKLMKRKALRKHSLHEKTAASVLLKLFISSNEWCYTTDAP